MSLRPRVQWLQQLCALLRAQRSARYFVKRGYLEWTAHDYVAHPYPVAVMVDAERPGSIGDTVAALSLVAATKIPQHGVVELDDEVLQDLLDDLRGALQQLEHAEPTLTADGPVVFRLDWEGASSHEWHDTDLRLQGVVLLIQVSY